MLKVHNVTSTDGTRLHVEERGPIDAPPILMLHGFGQCALSWKHQFGGSLEQRYRLITPDLRGHGRSDKPRAPGAYTDGRLWAGDVGAILNQLELVSPILFCLLYTSPSPRDGLLSRMPSSA